MDLAYKTLDMLHSPVRSQVFSANYDHHVEPDEARSLPLFMDAFLRGRGGPWPATPRVELAGPGVPRLRILPADPDNVERVDLYYCLDNDWPMRRFWRSVGFVRRQGDVFAGEAPFLHSADVLYAFGNVRYRCGARVSSRLLRKPVAEIAGAQPTLSRELLIDSMETSRDWNWVPAYTDPNLENGRFFTPWHSGDGAKGFTLDPAMFSYQAPMSYYFGTRKIGDPQFRGRGQAVLLLDCLADRVPRKADRATLLATAGDLRR